MLRLFTENEIKKEFEQTLAFRVERCLRVKKLGVLSLSEFAPVLTECTRLFQDGHFHGTIALSQAVGGAIARMLCLKNDGKQRHPFEENFSKLECIPKDLKEKFLRLWKEKDDYDYLNPAMETDRQVLETLAYEKVSLLKEIESEVFKFFIVDGEPASDNGKYWALQSDGTILLFLNLD